MINAVKQNFQFSQPQFSGMNVNSPMNNSNLLRSPQNDCFVTSAKTAKQVSFGSSAIITTIEELIQYMCTKWDGGLFVRESIPEDTSLARFAGDIERLIGDEGAFEVHPEIKVPLIYKFLGRIHNLSEGKAYTSEFLNDFVIAIGRHSKNAGIQLEESLELGEQLAKFDSTMGQIAETQYSLEDGIAVGVLDAATTPEKTRLASEILRRAENDKVIATLVNEGENFAKALEDAQTGTDTGELIARLKEDTF
ncbi:MAG: hypothetical protein PHC64_06980 [Candidatus Gastranaerophilales bacterium]|nr:hypothetical protein [Candidatus Gastranaerophilales bacterium]